MNPFELLTLTFENLGRRKGRVALTAVGVIIGTAAVLVLVSLGMGLQENANQQLGGIGDLTLVMVYPGYFEPMYDPSMPQPGGQGPMNAPPKMTDETVEQFKGLDGVAAVLPHDFAMGEVRIVVGRLEGYMRIAGIEPQGLEVLSMKPAQGSISLATGSVVVGSQVAMNLWDPRWRPGQPPPEPPEMMGETLRLTMIKYTAEGDERRRVIPVTVTGVLAPSGSEADWSVYMTIDEVIAMNQWFTGKRVNRDRDGYPQVAVKAQDVSYVQEISDVINGMGFQSGTMLPFVQGINGFFVVLQIIFGGVGAIALAVAAIGIANTMTMSILERTREIGLMKAIGARNRDVLGIFLAEAAGIGFLGGLGGVLIGWGGGQVLNVLVLAFLAAQAVENGGPPPAVAVITPNWLIGFCLIFATIMGLLSGLYPALRAATMVPVTALKAE